MANQWFRLYSEFATDPKVQMMNEPMQRRYIMLLCMRCSNNLVTLHDEEVAFQLRITHEELAETKELFIKKGFIDFSWDLQNWDKRQFPSDTSAARVAKHRALQKEKQKQPCNVTETLVERKCNALEQNRTEQNRTDIGDGFALFWQTYPNKKAKPAAERAFKAAKINGNLLDILADIDAKSRSEDWKKNGGQYIPMPATYLNQRRWEDGGIVQPYQDASLAGCV
jgi:hypothetical protein